MSSNVYDVTDFKVYGLTGNKNHNILRAKLFFFLIRKILYGKNSFLADVTFNSLCKNPVFDVSQGFEYASA